MKAVGLGLGTGARINISPKNKWNYSFIIMPGIMYSSKITSRENIKNNGISPAICLGFSKKYYGNTVSLGVNGGNYIAALYIKYGF